MKTPREHRARCRPRDRQTPSVASVSGRPQRGAAQDEREAGTLEQFRRVTRMTFLYFFVATTATFRTGDGSGRTSGLISTVKPASSSASFISSRLRMVT